jgi:hypothetical protein
MDQANRAKKETALRAEGKDRKRERESETEETGPVNINMSRREEQGIDTIGVL